MTSSDGELTRTTVGGLDWLAESPVAEVVRREIAERIDAVEQIDGASLIKRNMVRAVFRVPLSGRGTVIVKRYAVGGLVDWVKYSFKPSRAMAEWRTGRALDAAGIPTAVPFAMAERRRVVLRDAALVTREIVGAVHLNEYVETHLQGDAERDALRVRLYDRLARTVRRMHVAGFVHHDLHGGNVLVNGPPADAVAHIIDLHSVTRPGRARSGALWFDLVKLLHSIRTCSSVAERVGICRSYEEESGRPSGTPLTQLLAAGRVPEVLEPRLVRMERKRVRSRTRRCLDRSSRFDVSRVGRYRVHHLRHVPTASLVDLVASHRATLQGGGAGVLKDARRSALTRQTLSWPGGERAVIVKEYRSSGIDERLKNVLRRPRSVAAWVAGNGLLVRGFATAEPIALLLRGPGRLIGGAFVVMEDLGDAERLDLVALGRFARALDADGVADKRRLLAATARLFRSLHTQGVYHGDLKAVNLFVRAAGSGPEVVLADVDRVEFDREVPRRRRAKNLAQLSASIPICISLADRLRFFRDYARHDPDALADWKGWFRDVMARCERKIVVRMDPIE